MAAINLIMNPYIKVPLETLPANGKLELNGNDNDSKCNYSSSSHR